MSKIIQTKPHRLAPDIYRGYVSVMVTCCIQGRKQIFTNSSIVDSCSQILILESRRQNCEVIVFLFMPDHCHLILQGTSEISDPLKAIRIFKQKTGFWLSNIFPEARWQRSFYDHIIRTDEEIEKHIRYILDNPIRKNLILDWQKYPYKGSSIYHFNEW